MLAVVNDDPVSCTTVLCVIPRARQYAALCTIELHSSSDILDTIVTSFKSEVWSGEESSSMRRSETRTALLCKLHTCKTVARSPACLNATFNAVIVCSAADSHWYG
jgi:hypothetical protein